MEIRRRLFKGCGGKNDRHDNGQDPSKAHKSGDVFTSHNSSVLQRAPNRKQSINCQRQKIKKRSVKSNVRDDFEISEALGTPLLVQIIDV